MCKIGTLITLLITTRIILMSNYKYGLLAAASSCFFSTANALMAMTNTSSSTGVNPPIPESDPTAKIIGILSTSISLCLLWCAYKCCCTSSQSSSYAYASSSTRERQPNRSTINYRSFPDIETGTHLHLPQHQRNTQRAAR